MADPAQKKCCNVFNLLKYMYHISICSICTTPAVENWHCIVDAFMQFNKWQFIMRHIFYWVCSSIMHAWTVQQVAVLFIIVHAERHCVTSFTDKLCGIFKMIQMIQRRKMSSSYARIVKYYICIRMYTFYVHVY